MQIMLYSFTTAKESWFAEAKDVYEKKLKYFCKFETQVLKTRSGGRDSQDDKLKHEGQVLLEHLSADDYVVLFDEKAKQMTSVQFSKKLEQWMQSGKKRLVFVIGGAYGFDDIVKQRAQFRISFSPMTMNHLVAEVVAYEQLYRAFAIQKNLPYHNE